MDELIHIEQQFSEVLQIIEGHRKRAFQYVNQEMIDTYWEVGKYVSKKLQAEEWGSKVISQLSEFLRAKNPTLKGYKRSSIYNMKMFYETYSSEEFVSLMSDLASKNLIFQSKNGKLESKGVIVQPKVGQLQNADNKIDNCPIKNWTIRRERYFVFFIQNKLDCTYSNSFILQQQPATNFLYFVC